MQILKPYGKLDVLYYYSLISKKLKNFLDKREIATRMWLPNGPRILKRGSQITPLYVDELMKYTTKDFLKIRSTGSLPNYKNKLNKIQIKIWEYFVPRKYSDFLYATNKEHPGKSLDRIYFDIDRSNVSQEIAKKITLELINSIKGDKEFNKLVKYKLMPLWTGNSFHLYLFFKKQKTNFFYNKYILYTKKAPLKSFTGMWIKKIKNKLNVQLIGGHEKKPNFVTIDPSQSPSGKLGRCPFSLHMKDAENYNGIAIPLSVKDLFKKNLIKELKSYTPEKVIKNLNKLAKNISI